MKSREKRKARLVAAAWPRPFPFAPGGKFGRADGATVDGARGARHRDNASVGFRAPSNAREHDQVSG